MMRAPPAPEQSRQASPLAAYSSMNNLVLLAVCFVLGLALRRSGRMPDNSAAAINGFIVHVSLPALILLHVHALELEPSLLYSAAMPWLLFAAGSIFFVVAGRLLGWSSSTVGGLILCGALANTSFVGLPMIEAFYGASGIGLGVLIDQLGTYTVLCTVGVLVAASIAAGQVSGKAIAWKIARFAPFQALVLALVLIPVTYPPMVDSLLARLGSTLAPLALFSIGYQLRLGDLRGNMPELATGLAFKLIIGPALMLAFYAGVLGLDDRATRITVFEAAMGPMLGGAIVAVEHKLNPELVALMVGIGIPLSFVTLPIWYWLLEWI
jgi:malate permease and related proteins